MPASSGQGDQEDTVVITNPLDDDLQADVTEEETVQELDTKTKWNDINATTKDDDQDIFVANFWAKEWFLILIGFLVLIFDIFCCWLIYTAVETNSRRSGWGPAYGDASLMQHALMGDKQFNSGR